MPAIPSRVFPRERPHQTVALLWICLVWWSTFDPTAAGLERRCTKRQPAKGVCGGALADTIEGLCKTRGYNVRPGKRAEILDAIEAQEAEVALDDSSLLSKRDAVAFLKRDHTVPQGVVCECCTFMCTTTELMQYCASNRKRKYGRTRFALARPLAQRNDPRINSEPVDLPED